MVLALCHFTEMLDEIHYICSVVHRVLHIENISGHSKLLDLELTYVLVQAVQGCTSVSPHAYLGILEHSELLFERSWLRH